MSVRVSIATLAMTTMLLGGTSSEAAIGGGATSADAPSPRWLHGMAYDQARRNVVLFGGLTDFGVFDSETWTWDGTGWTQQHPVHSPSPRHSFRMVYDAARREVVLFSGYGGTDDTWIWDGVDWTQRHPATSPPGSSSYGMAYDAFHREVVLVDDFGGTWTWDGTTWTQEHPPTPAPEVGYTTIAYDGARREVVLFGGDSSCGEACLLFYDDTWTWDGTTWTKETPRHSPPPESAFGFAYDSARHAVVLFGGFAEAQQDLIVQLDHTGIWSGHDWLLVHPDTSPPARSDMGFAYDSPLHEVVLFGGFGGGGGLGDTWTWDGTDWTEH